jgi:hypothetical protein
MYATILFDEQDKTHTVVGTGMTKEEAANEVRELREENMSAFSISHDEYKKMFHQYPRVES